MRSLFIQTSQAAEHFTVTEREKEAAAATTGKNGPPEPEVEPEFEPTEAWVRLEAGGGCTNA
jgi:hypothetical protein